MKDPIKVRIVILNYNGQDLLPECLPSIVEAAQKASYPTRITILDNPSQHSGLDYVEKNFPDVEIYRMKENKLLCAYNEYLKVMTEPIAILLNNDIRVDTDFVSPMVERFKDNDGLFMVAPRSMNFDGQQIQAGSSRAGVKFGMFWCDARFPGFEREADQFSKTYSSGYGAVCRDKFNELDGYDERYLPGIMEDVDLSYRAQKKGYELLYEPRSIVYHVGQASFKKEFGSSKIEAMAHRNNFLFMWKNFSGLGFWVQHLIFVPLRLVVAALSGKQEFVQGFWQAFKMNRGKES